MYHGRCRLESDALSFPTTPSVYVLYWLMDLDKLLVHVRLLSCPVLQLPLDQLVQECNPLVVELSRSLQIALVHAVAYPASDFIHVLLSK